MVYKSYKWKNNPKKIEVSQYRNLKEQEIPFNGNQFQDYGLKKRIVIGEGEFFGEDAINQYNILYKVFKSGGISYLRIPKVAPFLAVFYSLKLTADSSPNLIKYEFEFLEHIKSLKDFMPEYHIVDKYSLTLWDIAEIYNLTLKALIDLNVCIKRPDELTIGQKVVLK